MGGGERDPIARKRDSRTTVLTAGGMYATSVLLSISEGRKRRHANNQVLVITVENKEARKGGRAVTQ